MDFVCKNCALWGKMLSSANAKMQKPRVKRALCLAGAGAGKVRFLRVWAEFVRGLSRGIRVLDSS